jgi:type VI secretion system protein
VPGKPFVAFLFALALTGCGTTRSFFGGDVEFVVLTDPDLNQDSPVRVELLVILDDQLLQQVKGLSAQAWFAQREAILRNYPSEDSVVHRYWELVPGQLRFEESLDFSVGARATVVFADYASAGDHRFVEEPHQDLFIHLKATDFTVGPLDP